MFELDKERFGEFLSVRRKEKGYTQKELARRLFVSDKAVSKWERGAGMPDISLLIPLAEILDVTVTELLEGQEVENAAGMDTEHVEELVKKALALSDETLETAGKKKRNRGLVFAGTATAGVLETALGLAAFGTFEEGIHSELLLMEGLSLFFGAYFWLGIKEKLPVYYDENQVSVYSDGIFRMNMAGVHFNNSNWPHIVRVGRIWSAAGLILLPVLYLMMKCLVPELCDGAGRFLLLAVFLGGLFLPVYAVGRKYE